jgi:nicotinamidase/pyrazinamidase
MKNILVRIDFQNDFVHPHGALSIKNPDLIDRHQKFADGIFLNCFDEIIETYDTHFKETYPQTFEAQSFPLHCAFGTWGWQQAAPFKPEQPVTKLYKSTTNLWNEKPQYALLQKNFKDSNVYLCGLLSDICVKQAMNGFLKRGANVIILDDLCQGAQKQICDILEEDAYRSFIEKGKLKAITSAQFFRVALREKKIAHNLVYRNLGE